MKMGKFVEYLYADRCSNIWNEKMQHKHKTRGGSIAWVLEKKTFQWRQWNTWTYYPK
jgi:hypothetical protein